MDKRKRRNDPMPVITIDKKYLKSLTEPELSDEKLTERIGKLGLNVEAIDEKEISVEVTSNRPDILGALGLARAFNHFFHKSTKFHYQINDEAPLLEITVGGGVRRIRPYIASLAASGVKFDEVSLTGFLNGIEKFTETYGRARKKIAIGLHDMDKIEAPLRYDACGSERFVPLNSKEEMTYDQALRDTDKGRKYADTIPRAGPKRFPVLKDRKGALALIPIINSERTKVTTDTKNILVDITGMSEYLVGKTADLIAANFIDTGASVRKVQIVYRNKSVITPQLTTDTVGVPVSMLEREIGVEIGVNNVAALAEKMGYETSYTGNVVNFKIPTYRFDVINEQDIVEDIAIAYGYDYIRPVPVRNVTPGAIDTLALFRDSLANAAAGLGFDQMMNSYLSNDQTNFTMMRLSIEKSAVRIRNPKSESITIMRTSLLPSLLKNIAASQNVPSPLECFELDMVFHMRDGKPKEDYHIAAVSAGSKSDFNSIKAVYESVAKEAGLESKLEAATHPSFIEGRCAKIVSKGKGVGFLGEIHPEVLNNFGIEEPTAALEIEL